LVTVPIGYGPGLDAYVRSGSSAVAAAPLRSVGAAHDWREVDLDEDLACPYGSVYRNANAVLVGVDAGADARRDFRVRGFDPDGARRLT
jgi:hypothetical protein